MTEWIRTHSITLSEFVRQILLLLLVFQVIDWDTTQQNAVLMAVSGLLALFTSKQTVPSSRIDTIVDKAIERRDAGA